MGMSLYCDLVLREPLGAAVANILVIEDDKIVATIVEKFLSNGGHTVTVAHDGDAGLRAVAADPPDLVITDVFMPEKDGLEAIRELRAKNPTLPVIAMSGGGSGAAGAEILRVARLLGAKEVLKKPLTSAEVLGAVERCLNG